jgi:transcriptional regulator of acetoin/glycerol metabolism
LRTVVSRWIFVFVGETEDDSESRRIHPPGTLTTCLVVALECDRLHAGSARYGLEGVEQITIGRGDARVATRRDRPAPTLDVRIPGRGMSAAHARLVRLGYSWAIEDLGSRNGTFVDGERVTRTVLGPDSLFEVGHTFLRVRSLALPSSAPNDLDLSGVADGYATLDGLFGADLERLSRLVDSAVPILLVGETGTGKEVLARRLHAQTRRSGEFVAVNCGALPATLVESQLFGHVRGAFSGAVRDEQGYARAAHGGTLFLDEIADLPKPSQASLLRVLQEREVIPVGATRPVPVDVRLLAATHQPLDDLVERGEFRQDLYARVAGSVLEIPSLRDRLDDMGILIAAILDKIAPETTEELAFAPDTGRALLSYPWPLNIRELEQCLVTCTALARGPRVEIDHLPPKVAAILAERGAVVTSRRSHLTERDERLRLDLLGHLSQCQGNVTDVARAMGKPRTQVHRWCKRFSIDPNVFRN